MAKIVLGRGLGSLIQTRPAATGVATSGHPALPQAAPLAGEVIRQVNLDDIVSSPLQPRQDFKAESLQELVESIREQGIIQPLIVRKKGGKFELIAGERRWRAAKMLALKQAPVIVREATDREVLELALIENLQRADLSVVEEARAYARLANEFSLRQEDIAKKVGKSRASVANAMRLLDLDPQVQSWLTQERLSVGHAKVLLGVKIPEDQRVLAEVIIRQHATVRAAEKLVSEHNLKQGNERSGPGSRANSAARALERQMEMPPVIRHLQNRLREHLATQVALRHGDKKGCIEIEYYGNDDLNRILAALGVKPENI
jgi:ParB family chromosome partitioning protein